MSKAPVIYKPLLLGKLDSSSVLPWAYCRRSFTDRCSWVYKQVPPKVPRKVNSITSKWL